MFIYYNANPNGENINDCVIRAMSFALDIDYYDIINILFNESNYFNCDMLVKECYAKALDNFGFQMYYGNENTVKQIASDFNDKILLLRINGHLTCSKYGNIYDTWDTSNEIVDIFWIIE